MVRCVIMRYVHLFDIDDTTPKNHKKKEETYNLQKKTIVVDTKAATYHSLFHYSSLTREVVEKYLLFKIYLLT